MPCIRVYYRTRHFYPSLRVTAGLSFFSCIGVSSFKPYNGAALCLRKDQSRLLSYAIDFMARMRLFRTGNHSMLLFRSTMIQRAKTEPSSPCHPEPKKKTENKETGKIGSRLPRIYGTFTVKIQTITGLHGQPRYAVRTEVCYPRTVPCPILSADIEKRAQCRM